MPTPELLLPRARRLTSSSARGASTTIAVALVALLLAACGGGTATSSPAGGGATPAASAPVTTESPVASTGTTGDADGGDPSIAALAPADKIQTALGETPTPACDTSVLTGAVSCVWTAADGSWLKVEDGTPQEMPDLDAFTARVTGTLGLAEEVEGVGQAAYMGSSARGARIAVFVGGGRVVWVVLNKPGDGAAQKDLVREMAISITTGL